MARDLINTPTCDMPPEALAEARAFARARHGAAARIIVGDALPKKISRWCTRLAAPRGRPRSVNSPRLVDFHAWAEDGLKVTLVGKGVCFDTGGLNIKPKAACC